MEAEIREIFEHYFPKLSTKQWEQLEQLPSLYEEWNAKINVVSRKDIDQLMLHHVFYTQCALGFMSVLYQRRGYST